MNSKLFPVILIVVLVLLLTLSVGLSAAGDGQDDTPLTDPDSAEAAVGYKIPIQGRLTNASGSPLNDDYIIAFRIYDQQTGGSQLCGETKHVEVVNGLFNTSLEGCTPENINGEQLYLGIEVESDGEMTPRQPLYPVPNAFSLVPGANLTGNVSGSMFTINNHNSENGHALYAYASGTSGSNFGLLARSNSPQGLGAYIYNLSSDGVALRVGGTGIIQSTAKTHLFVPGSSFIKQYSSDSTAWFTDGSTAEITRGVDEGSKVILIPITIPAVLYGQEVRVTQVEIYYQCENSSNYITETNLYKNISADSRLGLIDGPDETDDRKSTTATSYTIDTVEANLLLEDEGLLTLRLELQFAEGYKWIRIGGVRLTLEHILK